MLGKAITNPWSHIIRSKTSWNGNDIMLHTRRFISRRAKKLLERKKRREQYPRLPRPGVTVPKNHIRLLPKILPTYSPEEAVAILKEQYLRIMDGSAGITPERRKRLKLSKEMPYQVNVNLNIDPKKGKGHKMDTMFELLHASKIPTRTVVAFCPTEYVDDALKAGAAYAGGKTKVAIPFLEDAINPARVHRVVTLVDYWNQHKKDKKDWFLSFQSRLRQHDLEPRTETWTLFEDKVPTSDLEESILSPRSPLQPPISMAKSVKERFAELVSGHAHARLLPCRTNASGHVVTMLGRMNTHTSEQIVENLMKSVLPRLYQLQPTDFGEVGRKKKRARRFHYIVNIHMSITGIGSVALDLKRVLGDSGIDPTYRNFTQEIIYLKN